MTRNELVLENLKLVPFVINRHFPADIALGNYDDLYQAGCIGLIQAADGYDGKHKFSTYATRGIWFAIVRHKRENDFDVHVCRYKVKPDYYEKYVALSLDKVTREGSPFGDFLPDHRYDVGDEVVTKVLVEQIVNSMRPWEQRIARVRLNCTSDREAARVLGISHQAVGKITRKIKEAIKCDSMPRKSKTAYRS